MAQDDDLGVTFSEPGTDEAHTDEPKKTQEPHQDNSYRSKRSILSNKDDVFDVSGVFTNTVEKGTIVTDKKKERSGFFHMLGEAFDEWYGDVSHSVQGMEIFQEKEVPTVAPAEERTEVIKEASTFGKLTPRDDHRVVLEKMKTMQHDAEAKTGTPFTIKQTPQKHAAWDHTTIPAKTVSTPSPAPRTEQKKPTPPVTPAVTKPRGVDEDFTKAAYATEVAHGANTDTPSTKHDSTPVLDGVSPKPHTLISPAPIPKRPEHHEVNTKSVAPFIPVSKKEDATPEARKPSPEPVHTPELQKMKTLSMDAERATGKPFVVEGTRPKATASDARETTPASASTPSPEKDALRPHDKAKEASLDLRERAVAPEVKKRIKKDISEYVTAKEATSKQAAHAEKPELQRVPQQAPKRQTVSERAPAGAVAPTVATRAQAPAPQTHAHTKRADDDKPRWSFFREDDGAKTETSAPSVPVSEISVPARTDTAEEPESKPTPKLDRSEHPEAPPATPQPQQEDPSLQEKEADEAAPFIPIRKEAAADEAMLQADATLKENVPETQSTVVPQNQEAEAAPAEAPGPELEAAPTLTPQAPAHAKPQLLRSSGLSGSRGSRASFPRISSEPIQKPATPASAQPAPAHFTKNIVAGALVLILLGAGGAGVYYYLSTRTPQPAPTERTTPTIRSFFPVDTQVSVPLSDNHDVFLSRLSLAAENVSVELAQLYPVIEDGGAAEPADVEAVLSAIAPDLSGPFVRSLSPTFMMGTITVGEERAPFIILKTSDFDAAFAGMIDWEEHLSEDLAPFFGEPASGSFADGVKGNRNIRILRDGPLGEEYLLYAFVSRDLIVITGSTDAFAALLTRLQ